MGWDAVSVIKHGQQVRGKFNFAEGNRENPAGATRGGSEQAKSSEAGGEGFQAKLTIPMLRGSRTMPMLRREGAISRGSKRKEERKRKKEKGKERKTGRKELTTRSKKKANESLAAAAAQRNAKAREQQEAWPRRARLPP